MFKYVAKGLPMKPLFRVMSVYATTVMVLVSFNIADAEVQKPTIGNEQIEDLNKQLKRIDKNIKKQISVTNHALKTECFRFSRQMGAPCFVNFKKREVCQCIILDVIF